MHATHSLERIRQDLLERRSQLAAEVTDGQRRRLGEDDIESMGDAGDGGDVATATAQASLRSAQIARDAQELKAVDAALARVEQGQYGICVRCGREIGDARLRANPVADRCIECQTIFERQMTRRPATL